MTDIPKPSKPNKADEANTYRSLGYQKAIADGWVDGTTPPDKPGYYWVNLEREPGRIRLFYFYTSPGFSPGWSTAYDASGDIKPAWANLQTPVMEVFGLPRWYKHAAADMPTISSTA